ncbi:MAG: chorismate dehydratase [bacterium]|jgi:chorismate dehydratase
MLKLGVIDVLNVLPVYYGILSHQVPVQCEVITGKVTELNEMLNQGEIDISAISSFEYAKNPELYYIFPNFSVSAKKEVRSIYLFLDENIKQIQGKTVILTEFSLTSVHLIHYLLKDQNVKFVTDPSIPHVGELLIADEAIKRFYEQRDKYVYDLSELWYSKTKLPFVFALWAVRKESYHQNPQAVLNVFNSLCESKEISKQLIQKMSEERFHSIFPDATSCASYLKNLKYELSEPYQLGFQRFQEEMYKLGKLEKITPIEFIPTS